MADPAPRYALYYAPPVNSPWWTQGSAWLGRCAVSGAALPQPPIDGVDAATFAVLTAHPRRYGLHATLKPPFRLAEGCRLDDLLAAADRYARSQTAFTMPPLRAERLPDFLALTPAQPDARVDALAAKCVTLFDGYRAPLNARELARRKRAPLDALELALLDRWGYPYVLERYRFHLSLTGPLTAASPATVAALERAAQALATALAGEPLRVDALCVFAQAHGDADFRLIHRAAFTS